MSSIIQTFKILCRTPVVRPAHVRTLSATAPSYELASLPPTTSADRRPTISSAGVNAVASSSNGMPITGIRGYASDRGREELYSDESGSTGAGIDDVAESQSAYDTSKGPKQAAEGIEKEVSLVSRLDGVSHVWRAYPTSCCFLSLRIEW